MSLRSSSSCSVRLPRIVHCCCQPRVLSTADRSAEDDPNLEPSAVEPRGSPTLLPVRCRRGPDPESVLVLADNGVLSVDELLGVLFLSPPGVLVFLGTLDPNPTGVGRIPRAPFLILLDRRTLDPRRPPSSSELRDMLDPCRLGGRDPGWEPGVRELRPAADDWRRL